MIDLDTIDVSNLNRQFLFRPWHVGKPKCEVACEAARAMSAHSKSSDPKCGFYTPHHGDVTDNARFGLPFFKRFDIVLNALDNVAARRHVNRLCISAGKPLIEAGTTGYLGQSTVIVPKVTECYECQPKPAQKVYPICTIRSTPSQPVHCVVWAKEAFKLLFGDASDSMLFEDTSAADSEPSTFMGPCVDSRPAINPPPSASDLHAYASDALTSLFSTEITKQVRSGEERSDELKTTIKAMRWGERPRPEGRKHITDRRRNTSRVFVLALLGRLFRSPLLAFAARHG